MILKIIFSKKFICSLFVIISSISVYNAFSQNNHSLVLFDFENSLAIKNIELKDAKVKTMQEGNNHVLRVTLGYRENYPSVKFTMVPRDLSDYLGIAMDVTNLGSTGIGILAQCYNEKVHVNSEPGKFFYRNLVWLEPGETDTLFITFARSLDSLPAYVNKYLTGMRGLPGGFLHRWDVLDLKNISDIRIYKTKSNEDYVFSIDNIRAIGDYHLASETTLRNDFFPFVDQFGQYIHKDWPGKTKSNEDIILQRMSEERDLEANPGPDDRDQYGGWKSGPLLQATGHFRVQKHQNKWWFVDPEGRLFWSQGIVGVGYSQTTNIKGRENYFTTVPENGDFLLTNLLRKYGNSWDASPRESATDVILKRLRSWGINTIAGGDPYIIGKKKTPYTVLLSSGIPKEMPSTIDEVAFRAMCSSNFLKGRIRNSPFGGIENTANDPWCIGYFVDNELDFSVNNPNPGVMETYYRVVKEELKKLAPNKLYLGSRTNVNYEIALAAAAKFCDVISINRYEYTISDFTLPGNIDKPVIVGEFHFGALDRGLLHTGLRSVLNQKQRGRVYANYVNEALESPLFVGVHWFMYADQVVTARFDGENYQIGFIDICDKPYAEMVTVARKIGNYLYRYRLTGSL